MKRVSKTKKGIFNLVISILLKLVTICFGIILPKLFITNYGSNVNGLQSSVTQIFTYIALLEGGVGAATLQSLFGPIKKNDTKTVNSYMSATSRYYNRVGFIYFCVLSVVALVYAAFIKVEGLSFWFILVYVLISGALTGINFFFQAKVNLVISASGDDYVAYTIQLFIYIATSIAKILLIPYVNIIVLQAVYLLIHLFQTLIFFIICKKRYPWLSFKEKPDPKCLEQKNAVLVHKISSIIFQNIDVLLLTIFFNDKMWVVSIYAIYKMVVNMVSSLVTTFGNSVNFALGQNFNDDTDCNKTNYKKMINTFDVYYSAVSFALYSVMFILIIPFLRLYTKNMDINYIYALLPYLYITIEFLTVGRESMVRTIDVAGHYKKTQIRSLMESIINVAASIGGIFLFRHFFGDIGGIYGVLFGTIVAMVYRTIDINIYANKRILLRSPAKSFYVMFVNLLTFIGFYFLFTLVDTNSPSYLTLFFKAIWVTIFALSIFVLVQSIANPKEAQELKRRIVKILKRNK